MNISFIFEDEWFLHSPFITKSVTNKKKIQGKENKYHSIYKGGECHFSMRNNHHKIHKQTNKKLHSSTCNNNILGSTSYILTDQRKLVLLCTINCLHSRWKNHFKFVIISMSIFKSWFFSMVPILCKMKTLQTSPVHSAHSLSWLKNWYLE